MIQRLRSHGAGSVLSDDEVRFPGGDEDSRLSSFAMITLLGQTRAGRSSSAQGPSCDKYAAASWICFSSNTAATAVIVPGSGVFPWARA